MPCLSLGEAMKRRSGGGGGRVKARGGKADATRICNANFGTLFRFDGENLHPAAIDLTGTGLSY